MSAPLQIALAKVFISDDIATPVYTLLCGVAQVNINRSAELSTQRVRDCDFPLRAGVEKKKVIGTSWTVTASGLNNTAQHVLTTGALGVRKKYKFEYYDDSIVDVGDLVGTETGTAFLTAHNLSTDVDGEGGLELTWEGEGVLTYVPAP